FRRDDVGDAGLRDVDFGADRNLFQRHGHLNFTGQVRIVEFVGVAETFAGDEFEIFAAEGVAVARREIPERHFERAPDVRLEVMHRTGEAVRRKPFRQRIRLEEGAIDFLWAGRQNAVQAYGAGHNL